MGGRGFVWKGLNHVGEQGFAYDSCLINCQLLDWWWSRQLYLILLTEKIILSTTNINKLDLPSQRRHLLPLPNDGSSPHDSVLASLQSNLTSKKLRIDLQPRSSTTKLGIKTDLQSQLPQHEQRLNRPQLKRMLSWKMSRHQPSRSLISSFKTRIGERPACSSQLTPRDHHWSWCTDTRFHCLEPRQFPDRSKSYTLTSLNIKSN